MRRSIDIAFALECRLFRVPLYAALLKYDSLPKTGRAKAPFRDRKIAASLSFTFLSNVASSFVRTRRGSLLASRTNRVVSKTSLPHSDEHVGTVSRKASFKYNAAKS